MIKKDNTNNMEEATQANAEKKSITYYYHKWKLSIYFWLYLNIWCRYFYSHVMKLLHKFNLHYTTVVMPYEKEDFNASIIGDIKGKKQHLWCKWCGLRGDVLNFKYDE